jgi:hypothetical protein
MLSFLITILHYNLACMLLNNPIFICNIYIELCLLSSFSFLSFFYSHTQGYSKTYGNLDGEGVLQNGLVSRRDTLSISDDKEG